MNTETKDLRIADRVWFKLEHIGSMLDGIEGEGLVLRSRYPIIVEDKNLNQIIVKESEILKIEKCK